MVTAMPVSSGIFSGACYFDFPAERPGSKLSAGGRAHSVESLHSRLKDSRARDAKLRRHPHEVGQRDRIHLAHYVPTVGFHSDLADSQFSANLFVQQAGDYQSHHLPLAKSL
jgi:hypothetical protein